ncbi:FAD:protein FMN transferase [Aliikangiella sp. G2MR2-5]|uniref:FAD:protein FMN transferase n=1 Tax=Aliikangiella sp. G2MR2-5 TaxID=2788943 RepID=UPI0018ABB4AE|nr:FAD:protein FMN transferase [Aliikangiella sp. G2MR2-5]
MLRRARPFLGTLVEVGLSDNVAQAPEIATQALESAYSVIADIEKRLSFHRADSELSRLNQSPGQWVKLSRHATRVLRLAKQLGMLTGDYFNCTVGGILVKNKHLPLNVAHSFFPLGSSSDIEISLDSVRLKRPVLVTLDGIAKGYAVDQAVAMLRRHGVKGGWINAGGDLRVFGTARLNIQQRDYRGLHGNLLLANSALASSRLAEKPTREFPAQLITQGFLKRKTHQVALPEQTFSPKAEQQESIISVKAASAWRADALTKVAANLPQSQRREKIAQLGGTLIDFKSLAENERLSRYEKTEWLS